MSHRGGSRPPAQAPSIRASASGMQQALGWALIRLFIFSPKKEKKDKFLHQALTGTDKKNYRNQCRRHCFLSQLFQDLKKRQLEGEAESSTTKFGSRSQALGVPLMAQQ